MQKHLNFAKQLTATQTTKTTYENSSNEPITKFICSGNCLKFRPWLKTYMWKTRVAIGSDRKQFFLSDPTKNKNESDPTRLTPIRQYASLIGLKRIGFSKKLASASAIGSDFRPKMLPSDCQSDPVTLCWPFCHSIQT